MDIKHLADTFLELVESAPVKTAGRKPGAVSRKQLIKKLQKSKDKYTKLKSCVEENSCTAKDLAAVIDSDTKEMQAARNDVLHVYDTLKKMDLVDTNEVRFIGKDVAYVKDKKVYLVEIDEEGNAKMTPYKKKDKNETQDDDEEGGHYVESDEDLEHVGFDELGGWDAIGS